MYKLFVNPLTQKLDQIIRLFDNAVIPINDLNKDYQEYKQWLSQGNTPEPADNQ